MTVGIHELAALMVALLWAVTGLVATRPAHALGPLAFNRLRQGLVALMLAAGVIATGAWHDATPAQALRLGLSGIVGVFLGDTILYFCLMRLGPRRAGALFALNAPFAALMGWAFLGETLHAADWAGVALCTAGVGLAVLGRAGRSGTHAFEAVRGHVAVGVAFGVTAAMAQAAGSIIARPAMVEGLDPMMASLMRVGTAACCLIVLMSMPSRRLRAHGPVTWRVLGLTALSGFLAMGVGATLLLFALSGGKVGVISTLSALSPAMILPVLWIVTGARPSAASWTGAFVAVVGMALLFLA